MLECSLENGVEGNSSAARDFDFEVDNKLVEQSAISSW